MVVLVEKLEGHKRKKDLCAANVAEKPRITDYVLWNYTPALKRSQKY